MFGNGIKYICKLCSRFIISVCNRQQMARVSRPCFPAASVKVRENSALRLLRCLKLSVRRAVTERVNLFKASSCAIQSGSLMTLPDSLRALRNFGGEDINYEGVQRVATQVLDR